jgi:hypothetical protein
MRSPIPDFLEGFLPSGLDGRIPYVQNSLQRKLGLLLG